MKTPARRTLRAVLFGALVLAGACGDTFVGPTGAVTHAQLFDEVWHSVDLHYSFFELKQVDWNSVGGHFRPLALAARSESEFAGVLSQMLRELKDVHVSITPVGTASTTRYVSSSDTTRTYFTLDLVTRRYVVDTRLTTGGHLRYGTANPDVGYVRIPSFAGGGWASEIDEALDRMGDVKTIIVDVRDNSGGQYKLAASVAGRFTDRTRTFGYVRYRNGPGHGDFTGYNAETVEPSGPRPFTGRVYVLTNRRDFSSAEDFVLAMRVIPTVTVVGDTTGGASGGPIVRELPNGWTYQVSEWIEYTATKAIFEGVGLAPDVVVRSTKADSDRGIDAALQAAIDMATGTPAVAPTSRPPS
ncbi:MAG TPA: S41 family peptidase [Gemmatimonadaceae bacterium]|nr:S41 family peptidase [Gemmatimonadaceae bacterium]